jgi:hypothetical protein
MSETTQARLTNAAAAPGAHGARALAASSASSGLRPATIRRRDDHLAKGDVESRFVVDRASLKS